GTKKKPGAEEEEPSPKTPKTTDPAEDGRLTGLEREAEAARHPAVRELFRDLAEPHDEVLMRAGKVNRVEPLARFLGSAPDLRGSLELVMLTRGKKPVPFSVKREEVTSVTHYEQLALARVDKFLAGPGAGGKGLSRLDGLRAAETALVAVIRYHERRLR